MFENVKTVEDLSKHLLVENAKHILSVWPRWYQPHDLWVRNAIKRLGQCESADPVRWQVDMLQDSMTDSERKRFHFVRSLAQLAGGCAYFKRHTALCGKGRLDKRIARVVLAVGSDQASDDTLLRLDAFPAGYGIERLVK